MYLNLPKFPRYLTAAAGSLLVTTGITYLMVQLISMDDFVVPEPSDLIIIDRYEVREDEELVIKDPKPEPPKPVEREPDLPVQLAKVEIGGTGIAIDNTAPITDGGHDISHYGLTDGEHIPIVRVAPSYPASAVSRGIEGYVILSFTITPSGATADQQVVDANPKGIFDRAAIKAVSKFKYKPKVVDGEPQAVHNVQTRIAFELANG